ncbi:MAG: sensor histidine kinase [Candidatus Eiseniibacteriota bacterium]
MRGPSLRVLLVLTIVGLVAAAVAVVGGRAVGLLRSFAEEQALARVEIALSTATAAVGEAGRDLYTTVRVLSERPSLDRLLEVGEREETLRFLDRFGGTGELDGCAVFAAGGVVAAGAAGLPWGAVLADAERSGDGWFLVERGANEPIALAGVSAVATHAGVRVAAVRLLGPEYAEQLTGRAGVAVQVHAAEAVLAKVPDAAGALRERVATTGASVSTRVDRIESFVAAGPLRDRSGSVVGVLETRLGTAPADAAVDRLVRALIVTLVTVALLAMVASLWIARRVVRPLEDLTRAAARIGRGDLTSPIPRIQGGEGGTLAETMEEMRDRLLDLTRELRNRQGAAEAILRGISEGVFAVDRDRRITYLNPQAAAMLGVSVGDAVGRFCGDILNPADANGVRPCEEHCPIVDARFRGEARATERLVLSDGTRRTVIVGSAAPVAGPSEEEDGGALQYQVLRDETEEEAVRNLRDDVLAHISHEFRTPLSAQLASIEMIRGRLHEIGAEDVDALVQSVERATLRLTGLIDNLLESLRIESGSDSIRSAAVRLDEVVEEAVEATAPLIRHKGQRLDVDLPHPLPAVRGDAPRLTQVFVNLLANANKFAAKETTISVGGSVAGGEVTLWVEDQGPGIPDHDVDALFERFHRAGGEPEEGGMGLGLWIVRSIVQRHGGRARACNTGAGARLEIVLPTGGAP